MKILFMILMITLKGAQNQGAGKLQQSQGFYVEISDELTPGTENEFFIDMASLHDLPTDTVSIKDSEGKPDRDWIGANLCLLFETKLNLSCRQIKKISITAPDGYVSVISGELLSALETGMCAFGINGETKFPAKYGYMRLIFPQLRGMYWVNAPNRMIIELGEAQQSVEGYAFYFMDSENINGIIKKDLNGDAYIAIHNILINLDAPQQPFRILAQDGLLREYGANSINRRLLLHQEAGGAWKLTGVAIPSGLKTRNVFFFATQNKALFLKSLSAEEADILHNKFFQTILENMHGEATITMQIVLQDGKPAPDKLVKLPNDDFKNLYRIIEQQREIYKDFDHVLLKFDSN